MNQFRCRPDAGLTVSLEAIADLKQLEREWRHLESVAHASFFQSWDWLGPFLRLTRATAEPSVLRVSDAGRIIALGLLWAHRVRRHGWLRSRVLTLNATGRPEFDRVTIEHNGLLAQSGLAQAATACATAFLAARSDWDELMLDGMDANCLNGWTDAVAGTRLCAETRWVYPTYQVDLPQTRTANRPYVDTLSSNTRQQIRRAMRLYAQRGPLEIRRTNTAQEGLAWFGEMVDLHQIYWQQRQQPGAFSSVFTRRFHESIIAAGVVSGCVELSRVQAGSHLIGILYNFRRGGVLTSYQSGFQYEEDPKLKPGLVCHTLAAQDALDRGLSQYDFLMGKSQYKESLSNTSGTMAWACIQQPRLGLRLERRLRAIKHRWGSGHRR
jgi:CelD/BcsL family acetyltransferase involved in cellulose biosynthesis